MSDRVLARIVRRESHSPRSVAAVVAAVLVIIVCAYLGTEIVLSMIDRGPLLARPLDAVAAVGNALSAQPVWLVTAVGVLIALIGLVFVWLALAPGRLAKHEVRWADHAVLIDNGVIASALAQHVCEYMGMNRDELVVGVSHRSVDVTARPPQGVPCDEDELAVVVQEELDRYQLASKPRVRARVIRSEAEAA